MGGPFLLQLFSAREHASCSPVDFFLCSERDNVVRVLPGGIMRTWHLVLSVVLLSGCQSLPLLDTIVRQDSTWTFEQLDGPRGDVVLSIVSDSRGMVFAGMRGRGVFRSTDAGKSWEPTALNEGAVYPLYVTASGKLFAFIRKSFFDRTVAVSIDQGETWEFLPEEYDQYIGSTIIRQLNGNLYSEGMEEYRVGGAGLHRSVDDGVTWTTLQSDPPPSKICNGEYPLEILSDTAMFAQCPFGIFHSSDQGKSWRKLALPFGYFSGFSRDPKGGVRTEARDSLRGTSQTMLIRIDASGDSWEVISSTQRFLDDSPTIIMHTGTMLTGRKSNSAGILRSADSGRSWQETSLTTGAVNDFCETPDGVVFAAMHGAIFTSGDDGRTWQESCDGLGQRSITHLFEDEAGNIWAGTKLGGLFRSTDDGQSWSRSMPGLYNVRRGFSLTPGHVLLGTGSTSPNEVYSSDGTVLHQSFYTIGLGIEVSHDTGSTWTSSHVRSLWNWIIEPGRAMHVFTSGRENNLSTNGGDIWSTEAMFSEARDIHVAPCGIYVVRNDTLFFRDDDSREWRDLLSVRWLNNVTTSGRTILCMTPSELLRSTDSGENWEVWSKQRDDMHFRWFISVADTIVGVMGERPDIYLSADAGVTWKEIHLEIGQYGRITGAILDSRNRLILGTSVGLFRTTTPYEWTSTTE